jgi:hypothetical protein
MGRFATREVQLDELLRSGAFIDLYGAVKHAVIASVERHSIKNLEPFFGYAMIQDLADTSMSRRIVEHAVEAGDFVEQLTLAPREVADAVMYPVMCLADHFLVAGDVRPLRRRAVRVSMRRALPLTAFGHNNVRGTYRDPLLVMIAIAAVIWATAVAILLPQFTAMFSGYA